MCLPLNKPPVSSQSAQWLFKFSHSLLSAVVFGDSAMPRSHTLSKNYKGEPLPSGEDTAPNSAAAMAQILFLSIAIWAFQQLDICRLDFVLKKKKKGMTLDWNVELWDSFVFDVCRGLWAFVRSMHCPFIY